MVLNQGVGAKLKSAREAMKLSQAAFCARFDIALDALRKWEQGRADPGPEYVGKLIKALGSEARFILDYMHLTPADLEALLPRPVGAPPARPLPTPPEIRVMKASVWEKTRGRGEEQFLYDALPLLLEPAAAGSPREIAEQEIEGWAIIHRSMMRGHRPGDVVCVRVAGNSMEPVLPDRSIVAANVTRREVNWRGAKLALVGFENAVTVKLLRPLPHDRCEVSAYNHEVWPPRQCSLDQIELRGQVVWWWARAK